MGMRRLETSLKYLERSRSSQTAALTHRHPVAFPNRIIEEAARFTGAAGAGSFHTQCFNGSVYDVAMMISQPRDLVQVTAEIERSGEAFEKAP